jgi:hypothetical protein
MRFRQEDGENGWSILKPLLSLNEERLLLVEVLWSVCNFDGLLLRCFLEMAAPFSQSNLVGRKLDLTNDTVAVVLIAFMLTALFVSFSRPSRLPWNTMVPHAFLAVARITTSKCSSHTL